jgi:diguanylate cyclase (GGDEF)-like protein/PAS domain S-box-containing protein
MSTPLLAALSVMAIVVSVLGVLGAVTAQRSSDALAREGARGRSLVSSTDGLLLDLVDAETGQRGYLLTGDPRYLTPFLDGTADVHARLAELSARLRGVASAAVRVAEISQLTHDKLAEMSATLLLYDRGEVDAALSLVRTNTGLDTMSRLRVLVDDVTRRGNATVVAETRRASTTEHRALMATTSCGALFLLLASSALFGRRARMSAALEASEQRFHLAFDQAPVGMAIFGLSGVSRGRLQQVNRELVRLTGYSVEELLQLDVRDLMHPEERRFASANLERAAVGGVLDETAERRWVHASGRQIWVQVSVAVVRNRKGVALHCIGQVVDVTASKAVGDRLEHLALHDALTGLPNRVTLLDNVRSALLRAERHHTWVAVLFLDLDDFKTVNDTFGHSAGDELLVGVAGRIHATLRSSDTAARLGGDEFVLICEELDGVTETEAMVARLEAAMRPAFDVAGLPIAVTLSIGVALARTSALDPEELLHRADGAMYEAKRAGKARHVMAPVDTAGPALPLDLPDPVG